MSLITITKLRNKFNNNMSTDLIMMFLGTLGASLVGNLLARKVIVRASSRNQKGRGIARAGTGKQWDF